MQENREPAFAIVGVCRTQPWQEGWIAADINVGLAGMKTNPSKTGVQRALHCRCGREKILALGLCATCYTLKRQDENSFGGLREQVLERDGYCRVFGELQGDANAPSLFIIAYRDNPYSIL